MIFSIASSDSSVMGKSAISVGEVCSEISGVTESFCEGFPKKPRIYI